MPKPGVQGQGGKPTPMRRDVPPRVQRAQVCQQRPRLGHRPGRGLGQERQVRPAPKREFQRKAGKIGHLDLGRGEGRHPALFALGPQPVAHPLGHPPGTAPALLRLGLGHPFRHQPRHARGRVKPRPPRAARVDHHPDIRQRQRGFGNRRRQHHLARRGWGQSRALGRKLHRAEQGPHHDAGLVAQQTLDPPDFALARQENKDAALCLVQRRPHGPRNHRLQPQTCIGRARQPSRLDRERPPVRGDDRRIPHQRRHRPGIQRRRHDQKLQVRPQGTPHFKAQRQPQISVQTAFVKLVKDHQPDARQFRVGLDHPGQDTLGHHFDTGGGGNLRLTPDAVADPQANRLAQRLGHPLGCGAGGKAARLQHQDSARHQPARQKVQRHQRRLARTGGGLQHGNAARSNGVGKRGQNRSDGQIDHARLSPQPPAKASTRHI